jgi:hypothetical protein
VQANHVRILSPQLPYKVQSVSEGKGIQIKNTIVVCALGEVTYRLWNKLSRAESFFSSHLQIMPGQKAEHSRQYLQNQPTIQHSHCGASAQNLQDRPRLCRVAMIGTWLWLLCAGATKVMSESLRLNYDSRPCGLHKSRQNLNLARGERL